MSGPPVPQRVPGDVSEARASVAEVERLLEATIKRASMFTEDERNCRVADEWSTIESLRHIVFVVDVWLSKQIKGEGDPFHPMGLPPHFIPRPLPWPSIDPESRPTFDDACQALLGRLETLGAFVDGLTAEELAREMGTHAKTVAGGLGVIFDELTYHNGFINRDLDVIERERV